MAEKLGAAIRRLRAQAGYTLRKFAGMVGISAAHQSDIEHGRRMPSDKVLRETARLLEHVGATYEDLRALDARLETDLQEWVQGNPEAGQMLRQVKESGRSPKEILRDLERFLRKEDEEEGEQ